ncbi:murein hydrolase activator EnvC family protein [Methylomonas sp. MED-D]|uniref:murein hydrolase activator EnvC family protein n=1 Tax=Methylomonas sp. MED-D TaxID=3418768 RepID=UPI003CFF485D
MRVCLRLSILLAGLSLAIPVCAENTDSRDLAEIHDKIQHVGGDVRELEAEKSRLLDQLQKLERQYGEAANALRTIRVEIKAHEQSLQEIRTKLADTQRDLRSQEKGLAGLIRAVYAMGGDSKGLQVVLNQRDPALSGRMRVYSDYIGKARLRKLHAIEEDSRILGQLEARNDTESQLLRVSLEKKQEEAESMRTLKVQREQLLASLEKEHAEKRHLLDRLIGDEKKLQALVASLQKTDDNAERVAPPAPEPPAPSPLKQPGKPPEQIRSVKEPEAGRQPFPELQGRLPWPVQGAVVEHFGSRRYETTWDGVVISAPEGAEIRAITAGRVVYADWLRGYGLMIIIDHGHGYLSLYAFNQSLHKSVGDHVKSGEVLASVGRSGGRSQAALYFGIRKQGRPVDPAQWCRKPAKG